jgi:IS30 family transposase
MPNDAVEAARAAKGRSSGARRDHCAITARAPLRDEIHARPRRGWSPEEIDGSLQADFLDTPAMLTSHESIYRYVYIVARGALKRELVACPRRHHAGAASTRLKGNCATWC